MSATTEAAHGQASYDVRLEWGPAGGAAVAEGADVAVVVDVLSFTTTLGIAVARGTRVFPFRWKDERAAAFAASKDAVLAVGRFEAAGLDDPPPSLSPAQLLTSAPVARLVLPSPNGSTICVASSYAAVAERLPTALADCASGRELAAVGYAADVEVAAEVDADDVVPVLTGEGFVAG